MAAESREPTPKMKVSPCKVNQNIRRQQFRVEHLFKCVYAKWRFNIYELPSYSIDFVSTFPRRGIGLSPHPNRGQLFLFRKPPFQLRGSFPSASILPADSLTLGLFIFFSPSGGDVQRIQQQQRQQQHLSRRCQQPTRCHGARRK